MTGKIDYSIQSFYEGDGALSSPWKYFGLLKKIKLPIFNSTQTYWIKLLFNLSYIVHSPMRYFLKETVSLQKYSQTIFLVP